MPITGKQFELGIDSKIEEWMKKIYKFLSTHPELAYTAEELATELQGLTPNSLFIERPFRKALDKIAELDAAEIRSIREKEYYRVGPKPLDL